jgi:hypothetical protein
MICMEPHIMYLLVFEEDIPAVHATSSLKDTNQGSFTRSRAKKLQEQVNLFLTDYNFNTSENAILLNVLSW